MKQNYSSWLQRLGLVAGLAALSTAAYAQTPVDFNGTEYKQNFDVLTATGTTYPAGWNGVRLSGSGTANQDLPLTLVTATSNSGAVYNVGTDGAADRAIGSLSSASTVPAFGAAFKNTSGAAITQVQLAGKAEQWRSGSDATVDESLVFEYSLDATSLSTGTWTAVSTLNILEFAKTSTTAAPLDGNAAANSAVITGSFPVAWAAGATIWFRWKDTNDAGSDGLYAIDDFTLNKAVAPTTPTVGFGTSGVTVDESAGTIQIPITLSTISSQDVKVDVVIATPGGTATSPADYTFTTQTITIPKGATTQNATLTIIDDAVVEPAETIILSLQNVLPANVATLGTSTYTITITDNDVAPAPTVSTIAALTVNDAAGVPTQKGQTVSARGTIYGTNTRTAGYLVTLIDNTGGLGLFSSANIGTIANLTEGDSVLVAGTLDQFNGLTQISLTDLTSLGRAKKLYTPRVVTTALTENEESELIRIPGPLTSVDPTQWMTTATGSGYTVDVVDAKGVAYQVRVNKGTTLYNQPAPAGPFSLTGIGGQFDNTSPYTEGYQILPRSLTDLVLGKREPAFAKAVRVYPNPTAGRLTVEVGSLGRGASLEVFNALGQRVQRQQVSGTEASVNVAALKTGLYSIRLTTTDGSVTRSFMKQ
ncbi:T9SS type A sorting domain-containing protein [Hymenobacter rubripertinctus]|nr:T9SS type A sorting domain-containing protein [Hymenobacter rubripertinctus]